MRNLRETRHPLLFWPAFGLFFTAAISADKIVLDDHVQVKGIWIANVHDRAGRVLKAAIAGNVRSCVVFATWITGSDPDQSGSRSAWVRATAIESMHALLPACPCPDAGLERGMEYPRAAKRPVKIHDASNQGFDAQGAACDQCSCV